MVRVTIWILWFSVAIQTALYSEDNIRVSSCVECHKKEQIPDNLIYRRYLMKYSTQESIKKSMIRYLKNPIEQKSIMPLQFFLKFSMKEKSKLTNDELSKAIESYLEKFDIKEWLY